MCVQSLTTMHCCAGATTVMVSHVLLFDYIVYEVSCTSKYNMSDVALFSYMQVPVMKRQWHASSSTTAAVNDQQVLCERLCQHLCHMHSSVYTFLHSDRFIYARGVCTFECGHVVVFNALHTSFTNETLYVYGVCSGQLGTGNNLEVGDTEVSILYTHTHCCVAHLHTFIHTCLRIRMHATYNLIYLQTYTYTCIHAYTLSTYIPVNTRVHIHTFVSDATASSSTT